MNTQNDGGGPAFPSAAAERYKDSEGFTQLRPTRDSGPGMSLRDWFAGQVMAGWCGAKVNIDNEPLSGTEKHAKTMADLSYLYADAMLVAREERKQNYEKI